MKTKHIAAVAAVAYLNLGDAHALSSEGEKARKAYQTFLELAPNSPSTGYVKQQLAKL